VQVFDAHLKSSGLTERARAVLRGEEDAELQAAILSAPLDAGLKAALSELSRSWDGAYAVRSSATDEDDKRASHAGIYETVLGVRDADALAQAVKTCWASLFDPRATAYRSEGRGRRRVGMAVLVQRLIEAKSAGVLFTVNPISGSWQEMTLEAAWGLGEAVVGGHVVPDHVLVRRPRRLRGPLLRGPIRRVAARLRLEVIDQTVPSQTRQLVHKEEGTTWQPVPKTRQDAPKLTEEEILRLCRLGLEVEARLNRPQDLEWAIDGDGEIFVVQSRPITTAAKVTRGGPVIWTRRFVGERWSEPATPLGWSLVVPELDYLAAYPRVNARYLGGAPPFALLNGSPYFNVTVFRHLAFKLPGRRPPQFMMEMLPPDEVADWHARFAARPDYRVYGAIFRTTFQEKRWQRFRWNPITNPKAWDDLELQLGDVVPRMMSAQFGSPKEALRGAEEAMRWVREYLKVHIISLLCANLTYQLSEAFLRLWLGAAGEALRDDLLACPPGNRTVEVNEALWRLARTAKEGNVDLSILPDPESGFGLALSAFLDRHGARSDNAWEIMSARWAENPERVMSLIQPYYRADAEEPAERARAQAARGEAAIVELSRLLDGQGGRRRFLLGLVRLTRRYLLLRENQRYWFDRLLFAVKKAYLAVGVYGVEEGWLNTPEDVRWLKADEVSAAVEGALASERIDAAVRKRSARWAKDAARPKVDFFLGDEPLANAAQLDAARRLTGLGISAGLVRGRVRVLRSLDEAHTLRTGEILVAQGTDPGWTPLFLVAAGAILELGSQLSHGAVIAREYQLPAVVNVRGATEVLKNGQEVTLDGRRGIVWVHE